jgi:hypothetical protein
VTYVKIRSRAAMSVAALVAILALLVAPATSALAHERRTIANGKYDVVVGWDVEPAFEGQKNGAAIRITRAGSDPAQPVTGANETLKVRIRQGAETREFALRAVFGQPGYYMADIVPTRAGDYQWTFVGSIGSDPVNEVFDSADQKFNGVEALASVQFPAGAAASAQATQATEAARAAQSAAQTAQTIGYVGAGLGLLGLLAALAVWLTRPRPDPGASGRPVAGPA